VAVDLMQVVSGMLAGQAVVEMAAETEKQKLLLDQAQAIAVAAAAAQDSLLRQVPAALASSSSAT
jgi:hypothetical protein